MEAYYRAVGITPAGRRGRPRASSRQDIALAYAVRKAILGDDRGSAKRALNDVAQAFGEEEPTVKDAYTNYGWLAEREMSGILERFTGKRAHCVRQPDRSIVWSRWTREEILRAMEADLLDDQKTRLASRKSRRTKRTNRRA